MLQFLFGNPQVQLSLNYHRDPVKLKTYTAKSKKICCKYMLDIRIDDFYKLYDFLNIEQHKFYTTFIKFNSVATKCLTFLKKCRSKGYKRFVSVVEYEIYRHEMDNVYGNHYIIAFGEDVNAWLVMKNFRERKAVNITEADECVVLKNYTEETTNLNDISAIICTDELHEPIMLGKMVAKPQESMCVVKFDMETSNLRAAETAKDLLRSVRRRLNLPTEYPRGTDNQAFGAVGGAFTMLLSCWLLLHDATSPLEIKNTMQNINDQLIFVNNFYYYLQAVYDGGAEIRKHDKILYILEGIQYLVKSQSYETVDNVFCVVYHDKDKHYTTPVIYVNETNFSPLLAAFTAKGFTTLRFRKLSQLDENDDWLIEIEKDKSRKEVSFFQFSIAESGQKDYGNTLLYVAPCVHEHSGDYHWICMNCEKLIKVTSQARLVCDCGIGAFPSANPECFKCATTKRALTPSIDYENTTTPFELVSNPRTFNVLVAGSFHAVKSSLLNSVGLMQRDNTATNAAFHGADNLVVDYSTCSIRYISKEELCLEEFDVHGFMIVIENNTLELSNAADNQIRDTFSRLPRHAVKNCCIVNAFTQTDTFGLNEAQQQMHELITTFCDQHALMNSPSFICVDAKTMKTSKPGIEKFVETVQTVPPITHVDFKVMDKWKRLCDAFRPHYKDRGPDSLHLMATIAENTLTGLAIYCRSNKGDALPLCENSRPDAVSYWNSKDVDVASALQELQIEPK